MLGIRDYSFGSHIDCGNVEHSTLSSLMGRIVTTDHSASNLTGLVYVTLNRSRVASPGITSCEVP